MNDCITTTKQSTTKPCAYFLGYTVLLKPGHYSRRASQMNFRDIETSWVGNVLSFSENKIRRKCNWRLKTLHIMHNWRLYVHVSPATLHTEQYITATKLSTTRSYFMDNVWIVPIWFIVYMEGWIQWVSLEIFLIRQGMLSSWYQISCLTRTAFSVHIISHSMADKNGDHFADDLVKVIFLYGSCSV